MTRAINNICIAMVIGMMVVPIHAVSQSQKNNFEEFTGLFPVHYLPFSIAENELVNVDRTQLKPIKKEFLKFLPQSFTSVDMEMYAYAMVNLENDKLLLFHLEMSKYPLIRKVYMTVFSKDGFPEATELFASYEKHLSETYTYAIVNNRLIMHRTSKTFDAQDRGVKINTSKFRLNNIGEIVAL